MKKFLIMVALSLTLETNFALFASATADDDDDQMATDSVVSATHFSIGNREDFRLAALEGGLVLVNVPIQTHSYDISVAEFKAAEKKVKKGDGTSEDWVRAGLICRYGLPKLNVPRADHEALRILLKDDSASSLFHVMAMIADNDVSAYIPKVVEKVMETERLALRGNAPLLTVLLEIDQQTNNPVLNPHEYKSALRRIVKTAPNARAYIALAECVNANNFPGAVHGYYQNALALEPENVDAFFGAGVVVNNGHRVGISFPEGTPTSLYYFGEAYARGKLLAGNYYGCALYEKASVTGSKKDFLAALKVLEESVHHDQDALLSLADYHSTDHVNKPASFEASFECIKNYMKYDFIDKSKAVEVIENLKASMIRLEYSKTKLFCQISRVQMQWFADESSEMDDRA